MTSPAAPPSMPSDDAVLLVNLGTPDEPTPQAVRRYLAQFLGDPRVVELPRFLWLPILYGVVLPRRPAASAAKYAKVWTEEGSPLRVHTRRQAALVARALEGQGVRVEWAMRYGNPSIGEALSRLATAGVRRLCVVPLYPQYAASTTASVEDEIEKGLRRIGANIDIHGVRDFHDDPAYIAAVAAQLREHVAQAGPCDRLLMSFHGLPQRTVDRGDPYRDQCVATASLIAKAVGLAEGRWQLSFQSRFGAARWLQPYSVEVLRQWGREGVARVDVICPGFVSDCLETLEEMGLENREAFLVAGGRDYRLVPCLNERPEWISALASLAMRGLAAEKSQKMAAGG